MGFMGLDAAATQALEFEVIPERVRLQLTRLLRHACAAEEATVELVKKNRVINVARHVLSLPAYRLESDDWGDYHPAEHGWHNGELELILRRPSTPDLVETLADLIQDGWLHDVTVNDILDHSNLSFRFDDNETADGLDVSVEVFSVPDIEDLVGQDEHPNIRVLVERMDRALAAEDAPEVLHTSASIFEALAKDVVNRETVETQTLASFFERYRKDSGLPEPILDFILDVYRRRNTEPLAGHGRLAEPDFRQTDAIALAALTKAFLRIERDLAVLKIGRDEVAPRPGRRERGEEEAAEP